MKALTLLDGPYHYLITFETEPGTTDYLIHSVWKFHPGRILGEPSNLGALSWSARQLISEVTNYLS
jgi:hypothetical protein